MKPEEIDIFISRYGDADLSDQEREALDDLLAGSADAREALRQYRRLDGALGELPRLDEGVDHGAFFDRVQQAVVASGARRAARRWPVRIAALVGVALLASLAVVWLWGPGVSRPGSFGVPAASRGGGEVAGVQLSGEPVYARGPAALVTLQEEAVARPEVSVFLAAETEELNGAGDETAGPGEVLWCAAPPAKSGRSRKTDLTGEGGGLLAIFF